ncbi:uncharacterized protein LOC118199315 [Stegodyphus dumicola]|uniref:uncharacterized protein LOC118199315 n=1 Tax=Stegodyphus dumicola TaxID=202533 RepID=UPI0015B0E6CD|nr:uncharacterized protein LOC118199315 [Stegodyphus dumicola]
MLIDSGSQGSFIREHCVNLLQLKRTSANISVNGLSSQKIGKVSGSVQLQVTSPFYKNASISVNALIIPKITCDLPHYQVDRYVLTSFKHLWLADTNCFQPGPIDILLGADVFGEIMLHGRLTVPGHSLTALESIFGWVIIGKTKSVSQTIVSNHASCTNVQLQLEKFWKLEEISDIKHYTEEEIECENHFKRNFSRDSTVNITNLWRTINQRLGHMELIPENEIDVPANSSFYLPHHSVPDKNGDKFRVVFDGSAKSSSGISLNEKLMVGPQLQIDLTTLIIRFRIHRIAITADIEKMYRQIILKDADFQRIVWRDSLYKPIQDFRLTRIAYGTASASYLAVRCLQQLAIDEATNFPLASKTCLRDFYVDDLMSGASSVTEAIKLQMQLNQMLSHNDDTVKTLGILWHPASDMFLFKVNSSYPEVLTKRTLLSIIAKTFDPLGWLAPITVRYKLIMQRLWKHQFQWDEKVPPDIECEWKQLTEDLLFIKSIKISRFLLVESDNQFQLHGFCDASEKAYAAAIYYRSVLDTGQINVQLVIAKTRVAPLKTISLPRLELCGALLLTKLMDFTGRALNTPISQVYFHTDSTIVLAWIRSHASRWKTFVANRVAKIQTLSSPVQWHHVSGNANPADLATRGVLSSALVTSLWLRGPDLLYNLFPFKQALSAPLLNDSVPEQRCALQSTTAASHLTDAHDLFYIIFLLSLNLNVL